MSDQDFEIPTLIELAPGLWLRQEIDNLAWIDMGDHLIVVDALERPELKDEILGLIERAAPGKPVRYVLNTHTHYDHVALNEAFVVRWQAQIINQERTPLTPEGRWFQGEGRRVLMLPMPGCHTPEDCVVWLPAERVLFVGDIFGWGLIPLLGNLRKDSARLLMDTYARLIDLEPQTVVPGHGPVIGPDHLRRYVEYFHWLVDAVQAGLAGGLSDPQIAQSLPPPADMADWWRFVAWKHLDSVGKVIKSARKGWL